MSSCEMGRSYSSSNFSFLRTLHITSQDDIIDLHLEQQYIQVSLLLSFQQHLFNIVILRYHLYLR